MSGPSERQVTIRYAIIMAVHILPYQSHFFIQLLSADSQVPQRLCSQAARTGGTTLVHTVKVAFHQSQHDMLTQHVA